MVIPKKRQLRAEIIIPVFVAVLLIISTSSSVVAGAISPGLSRLFDPSGRESSRSQNQSNISRDGRIGDRNSDKKVEQAESVKASKQETRPALSTQAKADQSAVVRPAVATTSAPTVSRVDEVPPAVPDTAVASKQLSSEQTKKSVQPVQYQSAKISMDQRNELLQISLIVAGVAGMVYIVSYAGVAWRLIYGDPNPTRQSIVQQ